MSWLKLVNPKFMFLVASVGLMGCTQTVILFKPKPNIDPMPASVEGCPSVESLPDPLKDKQWNLEMVGLTAEVLPTPLTLGNANVRVAILSTGIDYNHEDICGKVAVNKPEITHKAPGDRVEVDQKDDDGNGLVDDVVGYDVVDGDGLAFDRQGSGTAVAGILAATRDNGKGIAGLMKEVTLLPVRYIDNNGQASVAALASALEVAMKLKPHVIFLQSAQIQLGGWGQDADLIKSELALLKVQFDAVSKAKVPVVVGAGEDMGQFGSSELDKLLRKYENVIVVTAVNKAGQRSLLANSHTQDVITAAPGDGIWTLKPGNQYQEVYGTAYAAAHVTAALGLARARLADRMDINEIVNVLVSADGGDSDEALERETRGGTRLNIAKFMTAISNK